MEMMIIKKGRKVVGVINEDLREFQNMNKSAEYTMKRLERKLSPELVEMLITQLEGFNEMIQDEMADNLDLYVRNHEVKTTGCPSVDMVLDVCYMWIAAELGEI